MENFYGLIYDVSLGAFCEATIESYEDIVPAAALFAERTQNDEEPYEQSIITVEEALYFFDLYDYQIIPVSEEDHDLFIELVFKNATFNNRLSYELEQEFYRKAESFKHEPFYLITDKVS